jgi:hypothetical protein
MTQNNKPEWFEITDADEKPANPAISQLPTGSGGMMMKAMTTN